MSKPLSDTAKATILLCSHLALKNFEVQPYTVSKWNKLGSSIMNSAVKSPENLFKMSVEQIRDELKIPQEEAENIKILLSRGIDLSLELDRLEQKNIYVVTKSDANYPARLKQILKGYAPPVLFYCGDLSLAENCGIAVVGSRDIDDLGKEYTEKLVKKAVEQQMTIFSGGAKGVDSIAAYTSIESGGNAIEVLASAMESKIRDPFVIESISSGNLLLLSAILPNAKMTRYEFIKLADERNKYVYALARATMVIASSEKGGTWRGAQESLKKKWGYVYVQNTDRYNGNQRLHKLGASYIPELKNISFADLISNSDKKPVEELNLFTPSPTSQNNSVKTQPPANNPIFSAVWYTIKKILLETGKNSFSAKEIQATLKDHQVIGKQCDVWLKIAVEQKLVKKSLKPTLYKII